MPGSSRPVYVGSFRHALDAKNRLTIPARWRLPADEGAEFMALPHPSGHIMVLPPVQVDALYDRVNTLQYSDATAQEFLHKYFSLGHSFSFDKQGRVILPDTLLRRAGIEREVMLVGSMTRFGIWNPDRWAVMDPETNGDNLAELMKQVGL